MPIQSTKPYYYGLLKPGERRAYQRLLRAFHDFSPCVPLEELELSPTELVKTFHYVTLDHPEIFWVKWDCGFRRQGSGPVVDCTLSFNMTRQEALRCQREIEQTAGPLLRQLKQLKGTDWDRVRWLHDAIIGLADYDSGEAGPEEKLECNHSIYGVFVKRLAVCEGYAEAMTWLLNQAGIGCVTCTGGEHAWNVISIEGRCSHFDVTWDDLGNHRGENGVCYRCFGLTDGEMNGLHGFASRFPLPPCESRADNFHVRLGLAAENLPQLHRLIGRAIAQRRPWFEARVTDRALLKRLAKPGQREPLWLPQGCGQALRRYRIFQPDYLTGWLRLELEYR